MIYGLSRKKLSLVIRLDQAVIQPPPPQCAAESASASENKSPSLIKLITRIEGIERTRGRDYKPWFPRIFRLNLLIHRIHPDIRNQSSPH